MAACEPRDMRTMLCNAASPSRRCVCKGRIDVFVDRFISRLCVGSLRGRGCSALKGEAELIGEMSEGQNGDQSAGAPHPGQLPIGVVQLGS